MHFAKSFASDSLSLKGFLFSQLLYNLLLSVILSSGESISGESIWRKYIKNNLIIITAIIFHPDFIVGSFAISIFTIPPLKRLKNPVTQEFIENNCWILSFLIILDSIKCLLVAALSFNLV